jgi:hypothetical protein
MDVTIEVVSQPKGVPVRLVLTSATGDEIATAMTQDGRATLRESLDAGIYYLSVGSTQSASYRLSLR